LPARIRPAIGAAQHNTASAAQAQELAALAEKKGALSWKVAGTSWQGVVYALTGKASSAVQILTSGIAELRSMGTTISIPQRLSDLARAHAELGQYDAAWRCINEAMTLTETSNERWFEADLHRIAGDLTLMSPEPAALMPRLIWGFIGRDWLTLNI
jgi:predicted ATPase